MKFGEYLKSQKRAGWEDKYLDYDQLKRLIKELEEVHIAEPDLSTMTSASTSLSVPRPTNAAGVPVAQEKQELNQEKFFSFMESEMRKIESFTKVKVNEVRRKLADVEGRLNSSTIVEFMGGAPREISLEERESLESVVQLMGEEFLALETFVNLNCTGFNKILKKHDRRLPNPCRAFYMARLHDQSWVRGDYSDVLVTMSRVYSKLRGDHEAEAKDTEKQDFVRSTRKYWVHMEDVSAVKYTILQHLPVFLQKDMMGETDSQLVNSVYLDNSLMELYHGRLEKTPGAIALRFRWYGNGDPEPVFVERKTHREAWAGEVSVKERFIIKEAQVLPLLKGEYDLEHEMERMRAKGKKQEEIDDWYKLSSEICEAIKVKQLLPTMRTQYMRTAFQIPFDATVRISLDTNLTMICDRTDDTMKLNRWYRDPAKPIPLTEITRFPHAILEIKLQLEDENLTPQWVRDLLTSGKLLEVHKFSKFIHGCAVLMPDDVTAVPYWVDDPSIKDSIVTSGAQGKLLNNAENVNTRLLPHAPSSAAASQAAASHQHSDDSSFRGSAAKVPPKHRIVTATPKPNVPITKIQHLDVIAPPNMTETYLEEDDTNPYALLCCCGQCCEFTKPWEAERMTQQKVEPKLFFANERTFISWLQMAVMLSSISILILAFASNIYAVGIAMALLPISVCFIFYALSVYGARTKKIKNRDAQRWDDPFGPLILTSLLIIALFTLLLLQIIDMAIGV